MAAFFSRFSNSLSIWQKYEENQHSLSDLPREKPAMLNRYGSSQAGVVEPPQGPHGALLTKLPPEIRYRIWQYVLSGRVIRLRFGPLKRVVHDHFDCHLDFATPTMFQLSRSHLNLYYDVTGVGILHGVDQKRYGLETSIALLRTCRLIHVEASQVLYEQNIFFIESPDVLLHLRDTRHFLDQIRHLRLFLSKSHCWWLRRDNTKLESVWERIWDIIAGLELVSLGVHLLCCHDEFPEQFETPYISPLLKIKGMASAQITIRNLPLGYLYPKKLPSDSRLRGLEQTIKAQWES